MSAPTERTSPEMRTLQISVRMTKRQKKMRPRKRRSSLPFVKRKKRQSSDIQMSSLLTPLTVTIAAAAMTAAVMYFLPKKK